MSANREVVNVDRGDRFTALNSGRAAARLRLAPVGSFDCGHAACTGKRRALRRMSAAREALTEVVSL